MLYNILDDLISHYISVMMIHILSGGSGGSLLAFLVALFGFLHLVDGILQVLLQPPDLWVHTHLFVCLQLGDHLEGTVRCVDEPELSDDAFWETVDCRTTVASLHQADGLCL